MNKKYKAILEIDWETLKSSYRFNNGLPKDAEVSDIEEMVHQELCFMNPCSISLLEIEEIEEETISRS